MENGFYIWIPKCDKEAVMSPLNLNQVVQVIEDKIWLTGMCEEYGIQLALNFGKFGELVLDDDGVRI